MKNAPNSPDGQFFSSEPSIQSRQPSHTCAAFRHVGLGLWVSHFNPPKIIYTTQKFSVCTLFEFRLSINNYIIWLRVLLMLARRYKYTFINDYLTMFISIRPCANLKFISTRFCTFVFWHWCYLVLTLRIWIANNVHYSYWIPSIICLWRF